MKIANMVGSDSAVITFLESDIITNYHDQFFTEFKQTEEHNIHLVFLKHSNTIYMLDNTSDTIKQAYQLPIFSKSFVTIYEVIALLAKQYKGLTVFTYKGQYSDVYAKYATQKGITSFNIIESSISKEDMEAHRVTVKHTIKNQDYAAYKANTPLNMPSELKAKTYNDYLENYKSLNSSNKVESVFETIVNNMLGNRYTLFESSDRVNGITIDTNFHNLIIKRTFKENSLKYDIDTNKIIMSISEGNDLIKSLSSNHTFIKDMIRTYLKEYT